MQRIHVCLVSAQPIPNLIPLRMKEFAPDTVILLVSPDMKVQADRLSRVIADWKIGVDRLPIKPFDLNAISATCVALLQSHDGDDVALNVTGGTKLMALAAFETFKRLDKPIIYVDTQYRRVRKLSPVQEESPFENVLDVTSYLAAYGQRVISEAKTTRVTGRQNSIMQLIDGVKSFERALAVLNRYVAPLRNARSFPIEIEIRPEDYTVSQFEQLVSLLARGGVVRARNMGLTFQNKAMVEFASGGWLEEYVYGVVEGLSPIDVKMGVTVEWDQKGPQPPTNEYDVIFTAHNQLYLLECKTKRFRGDDRFDEAADPIYKLDSLRDAAGGLFGKGMLVSYKRLSDEQKNRLRANRLAYCDGPCLKNLSKTVADLMM